MTPDTSSSQETAPTPGLIARAARLFVSQAPERIGPPTKMTFAQIAREWVEALVIAFIVAMFVRTFVVELFRIPSGSMSPTLIGDIAAEVDVDNNGELDQVVYHQSQHVLRYQVFYQIRGKYEGVDNYNAYGQWQAGVGRVARLTESKMKLVNRSLEPRYDRILVNKFAYWLGDLPERGDIMVFKVPEPEFNPERPFFIKRVAGLGGEQIQVNRAGDLYADGEKVVKPTIHDQVFYVNRGKFLEANGGVIDVPEKHFLAFGDNSFSSSDSRFWGPVPSENLKGKAFLRYWPKDKFAFLD